MKRLVLLGGGHSHVEVLRRFRAAPLAGVDLILVSPHPDFLYSGMLPGWIAGHYKRDECRIDLLELTRFGHCRFIQTVCNGIDPGARLVSCENGATLPYDVVSVDTGTRSPAFETPGAPEHALSVKPIEGFAPGWDDVCARAVRGQAPRRIAVVGGGAAGIEMLLVMQYRLRTLAPSAEIAFDLVSDTENILPTHNARVRAIFMRVLEQRGVTLHLGRSVDNVESGALRVRGGARVEADVIVWATGASAPTWPRSTGLSVDERGFLLVNQRLQSVSNPQVFASGDIATVKDHPRPKSGVYAVRAGPPLAENLRRALREDSLIEWKPQEQALALISTGDRYAIASRGSLALEGIWVWHWKNLIDRRFVKRYQVS